MQRNLCWSTDPLTLLPFLITSTQWCEIEPFEGKKDDDRHLQCFENEKKKHTMCLIGKKKGCLKRARFHAFSADYLQIHKCTFAFIRWKSLQYVPRMKTKGAKKKKAINNRCWFTSHVRQQQKRVPFLLSSKTEHLQTSPTTCHQEKKTRRTWKQKRTQSKEKRQNTQVRTA